MGGFTFVDPDKKAAAPNEQRHTVLTLDYFKAHPDIELPRITAAAIEDKSKGDALSKIIAILQTTWFIVQCIARSQERLALTELELVTLALASLNAVTFAIWWHKPLGVQDPVQIYLKIETEKVKQTDEVIWVGVSLTILFLHGLNVLQQGYRISYDDVINKSWGFVKQILFYLSEILSNSCRENVTLLFPLPILFIYTITLPFFILFPLGIVFFLKVIKTGHAPQDTTSQSRCLLANRIVTSLRRFRYRLTLAVSKLAGTLMATVFRGSYLLSNFVVGFLFCWFILIPSLFLFFSLFVLLLIPFSAFFFLLSFIFTSVFGIVTTSSIRPGASHVPSFYASSTQSDRWSRMVVFAFFGVIFGGLHCIGWNFKFPTPSEQTLWRSTSLAITAIPLIVSPTDFLLAARLRIRDINSCPTFEKAALLFLDLVMTILLFIYVPARLSLIAQALALLRSQPASALTAVDWTKYFPHLFSS